MTFATAFYLISADAVVKLIFQYGEFKASDALATSNALIAYAFGIIGYGGIKVMTAFYYATNRTKYAMKVAIVCVLINFIGNALLVDKFGHVGLAVTSALTLTANALLLVVGIGAETGKSTSLHFLKNIIILSAITALIYFLSSLMAGPLNKWLSIYDLSSPLQYLAKILTSLVLTTFVFICAGIVVTKQSPMGMLRAVKSNRGK
jgi:putative peptidoglycan lipid II flippase